MMHALLLIEAFLRTPWALMPETIATAAAILARWDAGVPASPEVLRKVAADKECVEAKRGKAQQLSEGNIAVLPIYGLLTQRGSMMDDISGPGSTSTDKVGAALQRLVADPSVAGIVLDIDSPGGAVYGIPELAATVQKARAEKPVYGVANALAASAAYWIGSTCSQLYCTPSGEVGSIGVYCSHSDYSKALETAGIKTTVIQAGKFKTEGHQALPLDDEARAFFQSRIDAYYGDFTRDVSKGRGVPIAHVRDNMGQGRCLGANDAQAARMIDGVATLDEVVRKMARDINQARPRQPVSLALARRELEILGG